MFSNTSYFKLYININIINNIIYSELLRTFENYSSRTFRQFCGQKEPKSSRNFENQDPKSSGTFENQYPKSSGTFENQDPKSSGTFENQDPKSSGTFGLLLSTKLPKSSRTIVLKSSQKF